MKKSMQINTAVCDIRKVTEEALSAYDEIQISSALLITDARSSALLTRHPNIRLECACTLGCEGEVRLVNGKATLSGADAVPEGDVLVVNGKLLIKPDAAEVLRGYSKIKVNGKVYIPQSLASLAAGVTEVNGKTVVYPGDAVALGSSFTLDRAFALRAQPRLYWAENEIIAADERLDCAALAAKGARFASGKALIAESLAEGLAPLFTDETKIELLPAGTRLVRDDIRLDPHTLRRYGSRLYVDGDVTVAPECAGRLGGLESLTVRGDVILPEALEDEFFAIPELDYNELKLYKGRLFSGLMDLHIDAALLARCPEGMTCQDCVSLTIDPDVDPEAITDLLTISDCVNVACPASKRSAVVSVCVGDVHIALTDQKQPEEEKGVRIEAASYVL